MKDECSNCELLKKKIKRLKKEIGDLEHKIKNPNMGYAYKAGGSYK